MHSWPITVRYETLTRRGQCALQPLRDFWLHGRFIDALGLAKNRAGRLSVEPQIDSGTSDIRPSLCTRSVGKRAAKSCLGLSPSMVADVLLWGESSRGLRVAKSSRLGRVFQAGCLLPP